ncbi:MAG: trigger factor [Acidobacteria bacterium]|nr:trigger factor [Acidobacteriota bacterium]
MRVEVSSTSACKKQVHIELPAEEVSRAFNQTYAQFARKVTVPGFRPGRAPQSVIRNRYGKEARDEVMRTLLPRVVQDAFVEQKLAVVGEPVIDQLVLSDGQPLKIQLQVEVLPEFEVKDYRGMAVTKKVQAVTDDMIESTLNRMRESQASLMPIEEDRPAQDGDFAEFALTIFNLAEGQDTPAENASPVFDRQVQEIQIGEPNVLPVFSENLRGLKPEETREFATEMENNPQLSTSIRGKRVFCKIELLALRARELPELDDAFAQGLPGEFAGLEELRQKMREQFEKNADRKATEQAQEALLDQLVEQTGIEVPEFLIQKRVQERAQSFVQNLVSQGVDPRNLKLDWDHFAKDQAEPAARDIKHTLLIAKIADLEQIEATDKEVDHEIHHMAEHSGETPAQAKQRLVKEGELDGLRQVLRHQKALRLLYDQAQVTTETITPATEASSADDQPVSAEESSPADAHSASAE